MHSSGSSLPLRAQVPHQAPLAIRKSGTRPHPSTCCARIFHHNPGGKRPPHHVRSALAVGTLPVLPCTSGTQASRHPCAGRALLCTRRETTGGTRPATFSIVWPVLLPLGRCHTVPRRQPSALASRRSVSDCTLLTTAIVTAAPAPLALAATILMKSG